MNLDDLEVTTSDELERFLGFDDQPTGRPLASYALWADLRPDVLKRNLNFVSLIHETESWSTPLPYLNIYAVGGWSEGVRYIMKACEPGTFMTAPGYDRNAVIETLAYSFYLMPSWGTVLVADAIREGLREYRDPLPDAQSPWPQGWQVDPDHLKAGLDYSVPEFTTADKRKLWDWYLRVLGEIPASAEMYAKYRPELLKAGRNRWENIPRKGLPNQMLAYLGLHYEVWRGNPVGSREALLLAKGLGVEKQIAVDAIAYGGVFYGGPGTLAAVADAVNEVLDAW